MKSSLPIALEILSLNPVQVMEGENVLLTPDSINVILDYAKYGIRDSGVIFFIIQPPHHGVVTVGSSDVTANVDSNSFFTLMDLSDEKVRYLKMIFLLGTEIIRESRIEKCFKDVIGGYRIKIKRL